MTGSYAYDSPVPRMISAEERVRDATRALGWENDVADSAARALARRQASAGKTCARCGQEKPFSAFGVDSTSASGRRSWCRVCRSRPTRSERV